MPLDAAGCHFRVGSQSRALMPILEAQDVIDDFGSLIVGELKVRHVDGGFKVGAVRQTLTFL